jgi:hypothetical protein
MSRNLADTFEHGTERLSCIDGSEIRGVTEQLLASQKKKKKSQFAWIAVMTVSTPIGVNYNLAWFLSKQN